MKFENYWRSYQATKVSHASPLAQVLRETRLERFWTHNENPDIFISLALPRDTNSESSRTSMFCADWRDFLLKNSTIRATEQRLFSS